MPPPEDSTSDTSLAAERLNRFIEDESTAPTGILSVETQDAAEHSPSTERIESKLNAFDNAFGDDRNGTAVDENKEKEGKGGNQEGKNEEGKEGETQ
jgi:hypothetical protein